MKPFLPILQPATRRTVRSGRAASSNANLQWAMGFLWIAIATARAASLVVTTAEDGAPGSLRDRIREANATAEADEIVFAVALAGQRIQLKTVGDTNAGPSGLVVSSEIVINGSSMSPAITIGRDPTAPAMRLFRIATGASLTLQQVVLADGMAVGGAGGSGSGGGGGAAGVGGAIYNEGQLRLERTTLLGNRAVGGAGGAPRKGGDAWAGAGGGGINGDGTGGSNYYGGSGGAGSNGVASGGFLRTIGMGNHEWVGAGNGKVGGGGGGGFYDGGGSGGGNGGLFGGGGSAGGAGGGFPGVGGKGGFGGGGGAGGASAGGGGPPSLGTEGGSGGFGAGAGATGRDNSGELPGYGFGGGGAGLGGAIFNREGNLTLLNSTFTDNRATGGLGYEDGRGLGGAIFNLNGTVTVLHATLARNTANGGGAIFNLADKSVSTGNAAVATLTLHNSILAGTSGGDDFQSQAREGGTATVTGSNNLIQLGAASGLEASIYADPRLDGLSSAGSPIPVFRPLSGSPVIDAGNPAAAAALSTDQSGFPRAQDGNGDYHGQPDLGSVEAPAVTSGEAIFVSTLADSGPGSLRAAVDAANSRSTDLQPARIVFERSLASQVVNLTTVGDTNAGPSALVITGNVILDGEPVTPAVTIGRNAAALRFRLFRVAVGARLVVRRVAITGGIAQGGNGAGGGGGAAGVGGAIYNQGSLVLEEATLFDNRSLGGEGGGGEGGGGGGINGPGDGPTFDGPPWEAYVGGAGGAGTQGLASGATAQIPASAGEFGGGGGGGWSFYLGALGRDNRHAAGGGIFGGGGGGGYVGLSGGDGGAGGFGGGGGGGGESGYQFIDTPRVDGGGGVGGFGGGAGDKGSVYQYRDGGGFIFLLRWALDSQGRGGGGGAGMGGAVFNYLGRVELINSTLSGNEARGGSGNESGLGLGGAVFNLNGQISVVQTTIANNTADRGGAVFNLGDGDFAAAGSNSASLTLNNSILAASLKGNDLELQTRNGGLAATTGRNNLIQSGTGFDGVNTLVADPQLENLSIQSGGMAVMRPRLGSPVVDAGDPAVSVGLITDQRGSSRVIDGNGDSLARPDLGAVEAGPNLVVNSTANDGPGTLRDAIRQANAIEGVIDPVRVAFATSLAGKRLQLSSVGDNQVGPSALAVTGNVWIDGASVAEPVTIAADAPGFRLFRVAPGGALTLHRVVLADGFAKGGDGADGGGAVDGAAGAGGGAAGAGGAIFNEGFLTITDSTLVGNRAQGGAGGRELEVVVRAGGGGGGVGGNGSVGTATVGGNGGSGSGSEAKGGTVKVEANGIARLVMAEMGNFGGGGGGGGGSVQVIDRRQSDGFITQLGDGGTGGIFGGGGGGNRLDVLGGRSLIPGVGGPGGFGGGGGGGGGGHNGYSSGGAGGSGGFGAGNGDKGRGEGFFEPYDGGSGGGGAGFGGAIFNHGGTVSVARSVFSSNRADGGPGYQAGEGIAGAVFNLNGTVSLVDSILDRNKADRGSAVFNLGDNSVAAQVPATATLRIENTALGESPGVDAVQSQALNGGLVNVTRSRNVFAVNTTADSGPGSLREAVALANTRGVASDPARIIFDAGLAGKRVELKTVGDTNAGPSALAVAGNVIIDGRSISPAVWIDTAPVAPAFRLFRVAAGARLHLLRVVLTGGLAQGGDGASGGGGAAGVGGAIYNQGSLVLDETTVFGNRAFGGNGAVGGGGGGGGINGAGGSGIGFDVFTGGDGGAGAQGSAAGSDGSAPGAGGRFGGGGGGGFSNSQNAFGLPARDAGAGGVFGGGGGGGHVYYTPGSGGAGGFGAGGGKGGTAAYEAGTPPPLLGGTGGKGGFGGGDGDQGYVWLYNHCFLEKPWIDCFAGDVYRSRGGGGGAGMGGAVFNYLGRVELINSTLSHNEARGGVGNEDGLGLGGAVFNLNGEVISQHSTLAKNTADQGGAIFNLGNGDFAAAGRNTASLTATNSIFASTIGHDDIHSQNLHGGVAITGGLNNLIEVGTGFTGSGTLKADASLGGLTTSDPIPVMRPQPGSPAVDAGAPVGAILPTDALGASRTADGNNDGVALPDLGAVEGPGVDENSSALNAWQIADDSTANGSLHYYTVQLSANQQSAAWNSGWRYSVFCRLVDDYGGIESMSMILGNGVSRFVASWDFNDAGQLMVNLPGDGIHQLTTHATAARLFHWHELTYDAVTRMCTYRFDGVAIANWPGQRHAAQNGTVLWGGDSSAGTGRMNFHSVIFEIFGQGIVAAYDAGSAGKPAVAPDPTSQGWVSTGPVEVRGVSPDTAAAMPPYFGSIERMPTPGVRLKLFGEPGLRFSVERSDDLIRWGGSTTVTEMAPGVYSLEDNATPTGQRFYRIQY